MAVKRATKVECQCTNTQFVQLVELVRHPGLGITTKTVGYLCQLCQKMLDLERQQKLADLQARKAELDQVESELEALHSQNN